MDAPQESRGTPGLDLTELGRRLVEAREKRELSVDDIAQRLHLPTATINDLEAGRATRIGTPVYLKGFLRSYLKLLALPEIWAEQALSVSGASDAPVVRPAAGAVARRVSWLDRYKWAASYVVGTALALTAVHWLVSNTPQLGFPDATQPSSLATESQPVSLPPAPVATQDSAPAQPAGELGPVAGPSSESAGENAELPPVLASLSPFRVSPAPATAKPDSAAPLHLAIDENSWIEVRDRHGNKLESKIVNAGEQRSFRIGAPFSVRIGNVGGVRATVAGQAIDLLPYSKGNVARFNVSENAGGWTAKSREAESGARDEG